VKHTTWIRVDGERDPTATAVWVVTAEIAVCVLNNGDMCHTKAPRLLTFDPEYWVELP
jgi:hypothetical protein